MSTSKLNNYGTADNNITEMQLTLDKDYKGNHTVSLTNFTNTSLSAIAIGSCIEINGSFYEVTAEEAISNSAGADTVYYIMCTGGASSFTAEYTTAAPTWSAEKQGFYGTGGDASKRYLNYRLEKAGGVWTSKTYILNESNMEILKLSYSTASGLSLYAFGLTASGATITTATITTATITTAGITTANIATLNLTNKIDARQKYNSSFFGTAVTEDSLYTVWSPLLPNVGDKMLISGAVEQGGTTYIVARAMRSDASYIEISGMTTGGFLTTLPINSGSATTLDASLSW